MGAAPAQAGAAASVSAQQTLRRPAVLPADFFPGGFRRGRAIPRGHVVVLRRARLRRPERIRTRLSCPAGYRMRSLATTTPALGFLVVTPDRNYYLRRRTVRMDLEAVRPPGPDDGASAAARTPVTAGAIAGLCRRRR